MRSLLRLKPYLARVRGPYLAGLAVVVLASAAQMAAPWLVKAAVEALERGARREFVWTAAGALLLFAAMRGALVFGARTALLFASRRVEYDLRADLFSHLARLPARWLDRQRSGDLTSRLINDLEGVRMLVGIGAMSLASTGLTFLFSMAGMWLLDPRLALITLVPLGMVTAVTALSGPGLHRRSLAVQDQLSDLSARAQENFSGMRVVKAFAREEREIEAYRGACDEYRRRNLSLAWFRGSAWALMTLFMEGAILATLYFGGRGIIEGHFTKAELAAFTAYQLMLVWPMIAIGWVVNLAQRGAACLGRLTEILDLPAAPGVDGPDDRTPVAGALEIRDLTFAHDGQEGAPALRGVSFRVEPGSRVGIVGRTGSGKSTLLSLLVRDYEPPPGTIFLDGRDLVTIPVDRLRRHVAGVPQDVFLFSDSLRANIAFGAVGDAAPAVVEEAARISRIAADAERFPGRLDQVVGERGVTLSGGQKQRTALARAIARDPAVLLLDDALSAVDARTEREILGELGAWAKGRTSIIVTHRLAAILDCDLVVVLEDGRVAESGPPSELLRRGGAFARLAERQRIAEEIGADPGVAE